MDEDGTVYTEVTAAYHDWQEKGTPDSVCVFRVVKEHREPREFWIYPDSGTIKTSKPACPHAIHVREVLSDD